MPSAAARLPLRRAVLLLAALVTGGIAAGSDDALEAGFRHPPPEARPQTWWHWMNGNISAEGITADLEAMQRIGIGGAQIFNLSIHDPPGPVKYLSPRWWELVNHAIRTADRLGLELGMENGPGWSEAGGPWVTPDQAMERVVWSVAHVSGGAPVSLSLPRPPLEKNWYREIAVLAWPSVPGENTGAAAPLPKVTTNAPGLDVSALADENNQRVLTFPLPDDAHPAIVQFEYAAPQTWGSLRLIGHGPNSMPTKGRIEVSDDGQTFRRVADVEGIGRGNDYPRLLATFPPVTARFFRLVVTYVYAHYSVSDTTKHHDVMQLHSVEFGAPRLDHSEARAGYRADVDLGFTALPFAEAAAVPVEKIVDVSAHVHDGTLTWSPPPGDWTILRVGATLTGREIHPAPDGGQGLEVDKMSATALAAHFQAMVGRVATEAGPLAGRAFKTVLADSWEAGCQNWTPAFREEFRRRRGYDPLPWLPALSGRIVGSVETSERFLWDYRRTAADLVADNHYGAFRALSHAAGLQFTAEAPGINISTIADELECKGRTDIPMSEFHFDPHDDSKETASAAHIYGARLVAAEAYTAGPNDAAWTKTPFDHKRIGDLNFTKGINRFVFHRYTHQPTEGLVPGFAMGVWGTNFERTNTWWNQARAWMDYITRCQYMLQQGVFAADVCYFYGEGAPGTLAGHEPALPPGYDYDACNAEVVRERLNVRDGRITLPDGTSYALLLLRDSERMTPELLRRIRELVRAGATVVGERPSRSPSLAGFPACDAEVQALADELWGPASAAQIAKPAPADRRVGQGHAISGRSVAEVLASACGAPDFSAAPGMDNFRWIHRKIGTTDAWFVSNQGNQALTARLSFRVAGRAPELWHADTGEIERPAIFSSEAGVTTLPVSFDPAGSVFVVFREAPAPGEAVTALTRTGATPASAVGAAASASEAALMFDSGGGLTLRTATAGVYLAQRAHGEPVRWTVPALPAPRTLDGPWQREFPQRSGPAVRMTRPALRSWTEEETEAVKYFSGTATYTCTFDLPAEALSAQRELWLDLGAVRELADVAVNGTALGTLWKPPLRVRIDGAAHAGHNTLELKVTNLWPNRLIGDQRLPPDQRQTWTTYNPYKATDALRPSGLLGPVTIRTVAVMPPDPSER